MKSPEKAGLFVINPKLSIGVFLHVALGSIATSLLIIIGANPILASSGVTIAYAIFATAVKVEATRSAAVFCGTFAGMTSFFGFFERAPPSLALSILIYVIVGVATGALYAIIMAFEHRLPKRLFNGYGGRLGAIAFVGSGICLLAAGALAGLPVLTFKDGSLFSEKAPLAMVLIAAVGAFLTRILASDLSLSSNKPDVVVSAATCGLVGGAMFLALPPLGPIAGLYWYAGNFAGMSSASILDTRIKILVAGAITGAMLAVLHYYGGGIGGLLGLSAFLSVILLKTATDIYSRLKREKQ